MTVEAGNSKTLYLEDLKQYAIRDPEAIETGGELVQVHLPELRNPSRGTRKKLVFGTKLSGVRLTNENGKLFLKCVNDYSPLEQTYYATDTGLIPYTGIDGHSSDYYNPTNFLVNIKKLEAEGYTVVLEASEKFKKLLKDYNELIVEDRFELFPYTWSIYLEDGNDD